MLAGHPCSQCVCSLLYPASTCSIGSRGRGRDWGTCAAMVASSPIGNRVRRTMEARERAGSDGPVGRRDFANGPGPRAISLAVESCRPPVADRWWREGMASAGSVASAGMDDTALRNGRHTDRDRSPLAYAFAPAPSGFGSDRYRNRVARGRFFPARRRVGADCRYRRYRDARQLRSRSAISAGPTPAIGGSDRRWTPSHRPGGRGPQALLRSLGLGTPGPGLPVDQ